MIKFDSKGHLTPYQPISFQVKDLKEHFVDAFGSETRKTHFDNYLRYSSNLKAVLGGIQIRQWINGSFVTRKSNPKDIDSISFANHSDVK